MQTEVRKEPHLRLSVILPVYNVEPYLERCIRSLEDQDISMDEYEIIVVNDGSPDNSREVALRLMKEFRNIILIDQVNQGVSMARNAGIEMAQGDFLLFVDPDDWVLPNTLAAVLLQACKTECEVSFLGYQFLDASGHQIAEVCYPESINALYEGVDAYFVSRGSGKVDPDRSWAILYNRVFIRTNELRYVADIPYLEDGEFIARVLCLAKRCIFSDNKIYIRTTRPGSATNSSLYNEPRAINGFVRAASNLRRFQKDCQGARQIEFLNQPIVKFALLSVQASVNRSIWQSILRIRQVSEMLKSEELQQLNLVGCIPIYKRFGQLYNISAFLFAFFWMVKLLGNRLGQLNTIKRSPYESAY